MNGSPVRIGINPICWSNDDLPALGGETPVETALGEGKAIGYEGFEMGGKFPRESRALGELLGRYGLDLVSGWYSGGLARRDVEEEIRAVTAHAQLLAENGATVMVYGEVAGSIQGRRVPLPERLRFRDEEAWKTYANKLTRLARHTQALGVRLAYHHHMGAYVESPEDIDRLMALTGEEVGLLFDSGHCYLGGGEPAQVLGRHLARVCHVHFKDVREGVMRLARNHQWSFPECIVNGVFSVPGDGAIDFAALLDLLYGADYRGWLVVEAEQDPAVAPSYAYAAKGYAALRGLVDAANARHGRD
ncbi:myo-inosose-2 dehydratase [Pseudomonas aeruginosa]|uniref:myo-inosose-2 dehydratase n=1 Tax=Pseudomonas aeruginosa TaxID=287 RepID=UPI00232BC708|nr:myo-inosose-2 dehydratase [Pseudomonas aeruginosa]